ncbi:hypothetical protein PANO111632_02585 [Paracoccus nototheniae]
MVERLTGAVSGPQAVCRIWTGQRLAFLIHSPDGLVRLSQGGFIAASMTRTIISPDWIANEEGWWAEDRSFIPLFDCFERWADDRAATIRKMSCATATVRRFLERRGYRMAEMAMVR